MAESILIAGRVAIITFIVALAAFSIGGIIMTEFRDNEETAGSKTTLTNETHAGAVSIQLNNDLVDVNSLTILVNLSTLVGGSEMASTDFNISKSGDLSVVNGSDYDSVNVTYSYNPRESSYNQTVKGLESLEKFSGFFALIGIALAAGIIFLIFGMSDLFGKR